MFRYEAEKDQVTITKYEGKETKVEVPDTIEGCPVTAIGDYAFSESPLTHLSLPDGVRRLGRYALYNCFHLEYLAFTDSLRDIGAGAFTGCHHVKQLDLSLLHGTTSVLKDILLEVSEELEVTYRTPEGTATLLFPEFFEEGVENTPARIIEHHTHGSGMFYRNCFVSRSLQFAEYDGRFPYARGQERDDFLIRLALCRLKYPLHLEGNHAAAYAAFLKEHFEQALDLYARRHDPEAISYLMQWHHAEERSQTPKKKRSFDL